MGRSLGAFDNSAELDRPDLNKCPDCGCFFAQDNCPLCGKPCPEEMRAGKRPAVKQKRKKGRSDSGRVTFIEWYHSWWFITIAMLIFPILGIVLLITSPYSKRKKAVFVSIAAVYMAVSFIGVGNILSNVFGLWEKPVDTSLSKEEYIHACESVSAEQLYRAPGDYKDKFVKVQLEVYCEADFYDRFDNESKDRYYVCYGSGDTKFTVIIRDCLIDGSKNLARGDVITVYGEGDGEGTVYGGVEYSVYEGPLVNMAYIEIE